MENFWPACLSKFQKELSAQQFNTWIKPLHTEVNGDAVRIFAPNRFVMQWVKDRFLKKIEQFAEEHKPNIQIELVLGDATTKINADEPVKKVAKVIVENKQTMNEIKSESIKQNLSEVLAKTKKTTVTAHKNVDTSNLNPTFNFNNYVTGRANQLARAAAIQVAENPGSAYNPLFIYGGVGLGKTHLLQAIGNELRLHNPDAKIRYLHAERYVSDVVKAYEHKAFDEFKRQYHSLDLLLIDDIQFFAKKTRTQEEFFYAFNSLIEAKKTNCYHL